MASTPELSFAAAQVRQYDRDRFATALFAPEERREGLFAVYAFSLELAKVRELVSEPMMGLMRLQWWREAVAAIHAGTPPAHPVALALAGAADRHGLSRAELERMIDSREADLDDRPPATLAALEDYAEGTQATVTRLALEVLGESGDAAREAGRHVGVAWALTGLLRAVPFHAAAGRMYLPADLMARHGVDAGALLAGTPPPGLAAVAAEVANRAADHLARARGLRRHVGRRALPALLPALLAERYLAALRRNGYDVFDPRWSATRPRPLRLAGGMLLGRY